MDSIVQSRLIRGLVSILRGLYWIVIIAIWLAFVLLLGNFAELFGFIRFRKVSSTLHHWNENVDEFFPLLFR